MPAVWERPLFRLLALFLAAAALVLLIWQGAEQQTGPHQQNTADEPESFADNAVYMAFDDKGQLTSELQSPRVEEFSHSNLAHMQQPRAKLYSKDSRVPWLLRADRGTYNLKSQVMRLDGQVAVTRPLPDQPPAQLDTSHLTLDNARGIVHTDAPVTIKDVNGITRAVGMRAWVDKRVMELLSEVRGTYQLKADRGKL